MTPTTAVAGMITHGPTPIRRPTTTVPSIPATAEMIRSGPPQSEPPSPPDPPPSAGPAIVDDGSPSSIVYVVSPSSTVNHTGDEAVPLSMMRLSSIETSS
jgi:hypothetical protein